METIIVPLMPNVSTHLAVTVVNATMGSMEVD